jgi:2-amino-4-hydroxy-6-hydroxymethyldihydropteridine diphosphokinase
MTQSSVTSPRSVLVAAGANLDGPAGPPAVSVSQGLQALDGKGLSLRRVSSLYATPCFPAGTGPDYVNAAAIFSSELDPRELLARLHAVEAAHDRARAGRWGSRTLDLDLIAVDDLVLPDEATQSRWRALDPQLQRSTAPDRLILPHPRLQERAFVLVPLADVAPDWRHPLLGRTVRQMASELPAAERAAIRPLPIPGKSP